MHVRQWANDHSELLLPFPSLAKGWCVLEAEENQGSPGVTLGSEGQVSWGLGWADGAAGLRSWTVGASGTLSWDLGWETPDPPDSWGSLALASRHPVGRPGGSYKLRLHPVPG